MTILSDDSQYPGRFLPVLSSPQRQGLGVAGRRPGREEELSRTEDRGDRFEIDTGQEDRLEVYQAVSDNPAGGGFDFSGRQNSQNFSDFTPETSADPAEASAIYQENSEAPYQPFYLGQALDLVG